jgi:hypothetical protein
MRLQVRDGTKSKKRGIEVRDPEGGPVGLLVLAYL